MYMLLLINEVADGMVSGTHIQWCCAASIEKASEMARKTEAANGNRIQVAVVDKLYDSYALGRQYKNLKRLDRV